MKYSFRELKEHFRAQPVIRFQGLEAPDEKNIEAFLRVFFSKYNRVYPTVYASNGAMQTRAGKRRSIGDIYRLCFYYFPKVRLTTVYKTLLKCIRDYSFFSYICHATGLRVYRDNTQDVYGGGNFFNGPFIDEYGVDFELFEIIKELPHNTKGGNIDEDDSNINYIDIE